MIASIPELQAELAATFAAEARRSECLTGGWSYCDLRAVQHVIDALDTARWHQAVESHRWLRQSATDGYGDEAWWHIWREVMALRWSIGERRGRPAGFIPSKEIALRDQPPKITKPVSFAMFTHRCWSWGFLRAHVYPPGKGFAGDRCMCGEVTAGDEACRAAGGEQ